MRLSDPQKKTQPPPLELRNEDPAEMKAYLKERAALLVTAFCLIGILGLGIIGLGINWFEAHKEEQEAERISREKANVPSSASSTASFLVAAYRNCQPLGLDVNQCADHRGPLPEEQAASQIAAMAVAYRDGFVKTCTNHHEYEYCANLLNRAVRLQWARHKN